MSMIQRAKMTYMVEKWLKLLNIEENGWKSIFQDRLLEVYLTR